MPELEVIKKKIIDDDIKNAEEIVKNAEDECREMIKEAEEKANSYIDDMTKKAERDGSEMKSKVIETIKFELRDNLLKAKQEIMDKVFERAIKIADEMSEKDYCSLMSKLIIKNIETGNEKILVSENENRLNNNFIENVNSELKNNGRIGSLQIEFNSRITGSGFIIKRNEIEVDCTFDELLRANKYNLETYIIKELFSQIQVVGGV